MIRIRYDDFSAGTHDGTWLHGRAERGARGVTVYLLPGLTTGQRRAVIRRLRQEASRGFGPPLPQPQLAIALGLDRVRTAARVAGAIIRLHPAGTLVPGACVAVMMALFVVASAGGPGVASKTPGGLAQAASIGGSAAQALAVGQGDAQSPLVTVAEGTDPSGTGGTGLGSGQHAQAKRHHRRRHRRRRFARSGAWYACQPSATAQGLRSRAAKPACCRARLRRAPYTAHFPGPQVLAR